MRSVRLADVLNVQGDPGRAELRARVSSSAYTVTLATRDRPGPFSRFHVKSGTSTTRMTAPLDTRYSMNTRFDLAAGSSNSRRPSVLRSRV